MSGDDRGGGPPALPGAVPLHVGGVAPVEPPQGRVEPPRGRAGAGPRSPARAGGARRSTRRGLLRLRAALLLLTALACGSVTWSFAATTATATSVREHAAPAVLQAATARHALADTHLEAVTVLAAAVRDARDGTAPALTLLTGPGEEYEKRLALAGQYLNQVAEDNVAGPTASARIQLSVELISAYAGWIGQAGAHLHRDPAGLLGPTDLWYASRVLTTPDSGVLRHLDALLTDQRTALDALLAATTTTASGTLALLLPVLALAALLVVAQARLSRRFRRTWNPPLLAATALTTALAGLALWGAHTQARVEAASADVVAVADGWQRRTDDATARARAELLAMLGPGCVDACGPTVAEVAGVDPPAGAATLEKGADLTDRALTARTELADADHGAWTPLGPLCGALLAALVLLGLHPRLDEHRFRPR
ncbi:MULTISPECIES: hypothetical protein [Actinosynnema]|uniref:hypothetical protein n=1 Tax=Actinosynnema TaxID=40566 RepID=UPI0020A49B8B|nr:hypothetical protein [Actinosynnema pretiosum]MCP2092487.1 hypothetical protein [Actinosynnema pretiosum]